MKLMLTSAGISNKSLADALKKLIGEVIKIAFIPTAANKEGGDKDWLIDDLVNCKKLGEVDIVDISALPKDIWLPRLEKANVIFVGGGDTVYLMDWITKSELANELPELLKTRVYVGISAGSCVMSKKFSFKDLIIYPDENGQEHTGLRYVDFSILPHFNSSDFPKLKDAILKKALSNLNVDIYALDDESGIVYVDGKIEIVSEGKWIKYSKED